MASKNKILVKEARNGQKFAVVKSSNNKTLAVTETYKRKDGVNNAVKALKKVIKNAIVIDQTKKD
jgi:uncharacterized protein YegP (UPF0339 family)